MTTDKFIKTRQKAHWIAFFKYLHREHYCKPLICGHRRKWDVFWYVFSQGFTIFTPPAVPPFLFTQLAHIWKLKRTHLKLPFGDYDIPVIRLSIRVWAHAVVLWALCAHGLCDHIKYSENSFSDFFFWWPFDKDHWLQQKSAAVFSEGSDTRSSSCGWSCTTTVSVQHVPSLLLHLWAVKHTITLQH